MRTNGNRVVAAVALSGTIPLASPKVTEYSIRRQPVALLLTGHAVFRCIGGVTLIRAFVRNLRTGPVMPRERHKWKTHKAESTDALARGALLCSSEEAG